MDDSRASVNLDYAWRQQRIWSKTADRLKTRIERGRTTALLLGIIAAGLGVVAVQVGTKYPAGRWFSFAAGVSAALVPFAYRLSSTEHVRAWTRARSASEALKSEVYTFLGCTPDRRNDDANRHLGNKARSIVAGVGDLRQHEAEHVPADKSLPDVQDIDTYVDARVNGQIAWYRERSRDYIRTAGRLRRIGNGLAAAAAVLGVAAGTLDQVALAAWVPFLTTVGSSLAAHIAASRYDHMIIGYLRTEQQLEHLRDTRSQADITDSAFIEVCESVISIENQAWMSRWQTPGDTQ